MYVGTYNINDDGGDAVLSTHVVITIIIKLHECIHTYYILYTIILCPYVCSYTRRHRVRRNYLHTGVETRNFSGKVSIRGEN